MRLFFTFLFLNALAVSGWGQCNVGGIYIDAFLADPNGSNNFDTDGSGDAATVDEFVRICNSNSSSVNLSSYTIADEGIAPYQLSGNLGPGECITIVRNWTTMPIPSTIFDLDIGGGWLNNGGDVITISDGSSSCSVAYGSGSCGGDPNCVSWPEQDGCVTAGGMVDCSITPSDLLQSTPLPVEFSNIEARRTDDGNVKVQWSTATEVNNDHFVVQHSYDGREFEDFARVEGAGTTYEEMTYSAEHSAPIKGINYYRIAQVDYDGTTSHSDIVSIQMSKALTLQLRPTIVENTLNYDVGNATAKMIIMSIDGSMYQEQYVDNQGQVDCSHLAPGLYTITVVTGTEAVTQRITKI